MPRFENAIMQGDWLRVRRLGGESRQFRTAHPARGRSSSARSGGPDRPYPLEAAQKVWREAPRRRVDRVRPAS